MKNTKYLIGLFIIIIVSMTSCDKNFLDKKPLDEISSKSILKRQPDLELYMNQFYQPHLLEYGGEGGENYSQLIFLADLNSDNMIDESFDERLNGTRVVPSSGGGWNYDECQSD